MPVGVVSAAAFGVGTGDHGITSTRVVLRYSSNGSRKLKNAEQQSLPQPRATAATGALYMNNIFTDLGDMLTGGKLVPQLSSPLPYGKPLELPSPSSGGPRTLAVAERPVSFTGEDFDVRDAQSNQLVFRVRGAMLHLPGKDKMRILQGRDVVIAELDRKLVAVTPTYDLYRGNGQEKIGWIEKVVVALTDTFEVHIEGQPGGFGPFKPPAAYRIEGDFVDRNFVMKNDKNEVVAKVSKDGWVQFDAFNHYQIQLAPGMDAGLVVACACAIDEEFDEEHEKAREKKEKEKEGGGWFG